MFAGIRMESRVMSLYGKIRVRKNPYFSIFYAVNLKVRQPRKVRLGVLDHFREDSAEFCNIFINVHIKHYKFYGMNSNYESPF